MILNCELQSFWIYMIPDVFSGTFMIPNLLSWEALTMNSYSALAWITLFPRALHMYLTPDIANRGWLQLLRC
jgi:hypothetical protein